MKESKVEMTGKYVSNSTKSRFVVDTLKVDGEKSILHPNHSVKGLTQKQFSDLARQVYERLKLYDKAKLVLTITEN